MHKTRLTPSRWRFNVAAFASVLLFLFATPMVQSAPGPFFPTKPNIIFILADDLGYGDLGCYGQTKIKTPNIDQLASEGIRFTSVYAGSTVCAPSRCALMTGLHSGHGNIRGNGHNMSLGPGDVTVAEVLKQAGYRTGLIGKWGLGEKDSTGEPGKKGFDDFAGYLNQTHAHDYYTDHLFRSGPRVPVPQGESVFRQTFPENNEESRKHMPGTPKVYMPDLFAKSATTFVRLFKPDQFNPPPFFLYLATITPHANNEEGRRSGNGMQVPSDAPYSKESWPQVEKNKAAMITRMDEDIGKLMAELKKLKIDSNTIVFFSSDNGPHKEGGVDPKFFSSSGPLRGIKRDLSEGGIRVPMIVRWPDAIKPGQVNDTPWAFWDVLPTLAEIAKAKTPMNLDGISMVPTLVGQRQTNLHAAFYWEFHERGFQQAARMGNFKALKLDPDKPLELYDLSKDIGEKDNIADKNPELVAKLEAYLKAGRTPSDNWPIKKAPPATPAPRAQQSGQ